MCLFAVGFVSCLFCCWMMIIVFRFALIVYCGLVFDFVVLGSRFWFCLLVWVWCRRKFAVLGDLGGLGVLIFGIDCGFCDVVFLNFGIWYFGFCCVVIAYFWAFDVMLVSLGLV